MVILTGMADEEQLESSHTGSVGNEDLLIIGPGVLGRIIAEKWKQVIANPFAVLLSI